MILDEVLYESREFDTDSMVDMFVEGFLYALEMQEAGYKAGSTEELSMNIAEAADIAISELSNDLKVHAAKKAELIGKLHLAKSTDHSNRGLSAQYYNDDSTTARKHFQALQPTVWIKGPHHVFKTRIQSSHCGSAIGKLTSIHEDAGFDPWPRSVG